MTIVAGAIEYGGNLRRHLKPGFDRLVRVARRVRLRWSKKLRDHQANDHDNQQPSQNSKKSFHARYLLRPCQTMTPLHNSLSTITPQLPRWLTKHQSLFQ